MFYQGDIEHECPRTPMGILFKELGQCQPMADYHMRTDEEGKPLREDCLAHNFMYYYTSPEVASAFSNFYRNVN